MFLSAKRMLMRALPRRFVMGWMVMLVFQHPAGGLQILVPRSPAPDQGQREHEGEAARDHLVERRTQNLNRGKFDRLAWLNPRREIGHALKDL